MAENTQLNNLDAQSVEATADPVVPAGNTNDNVAKVNEQANATSSPEMKNVQDLTRYVELLLQQMQERFQGISEQVLARIDDMGNRIDDLERNIADLVTQSGVEGPAK